MSRTLDEVRQLGLAALRDRLGRADMVRFIQQFTSGHGDYSTDRHDWVDKTSLAAIRSAAKSKPTGQSTKPKIRATKPRRK